jgi:hypothetical protein
MGECPQDHPWIGDLAISPEIGSKLRYNGHAAYVRGVHTSNSTLDIQMHQYYKRENGEWTKCTMDPDVGGAYPDSCVLGKAPIKNVARAAIGAFDAAVWCPERMNYVGDMQLSGGGMFGPNYEYSHNQADTYQGLYPYTEFIEVAVDEPVFVFRITMGISRGAGAVVAIKAKNPTAAAGTDPWVVLYRGSPMLSVYNELKSSNT